MFIRPGTLIHLAMLARNESPTNIAAALGISTSTVSSYLLSRRYISSPAINDIASKYAHYVEPVLSGNIKNSSVIEYFIDCYKVEENVRQLMEVANPSTFTYCTASALSYYNDSDSEFSRTDAITLLSYAVDNYLKAHKLYSLAREAISGYRELFIKYLFYRIKNYDHFLLYVFNPQKAHFTDMIEVRDKNYKIPLHKEHQINFNQLIAMQNAIANKLDPNDQLIESIPKIPLLKTAAAIDFLMSIANKFTVEQRMVPETMIETEFDFDNGTEFEIETTKHFYFGRYKSECKCTIYFDFNNKEEVIECGAGAIDNDYFERLLRIFKS
ncbi:MAG: hypothetical protein A4E56_01894 [Pelotomaculum sp. PtaU1.Bin065]|nr:MAG: hypothetical protein A4E56_01894 [Pelotomaculum sp. PtaU1.Bin065]